MVECGGGGCDEAEKGGTEWAHGHDVDEAETGVGAAVEEMGAEGDETGVVVSDDVGWCFPGGGGLPVVEEGGEGGGLSGEGCV